jgi:ribosome biogenesis GTPase A
MMILGIPNVGKSSLINRLTGRKSAKTGDKPGVTRGKQWLKLENGMELLDTPGILWPNIDDPEQGKHLAFCGAINDDIYDISDLGLELISYLMKADMELLMKRYKFTEDDVEARFEEIEAEGGSKELAVMDVISMKRGFILPGKRIDYERCAKKLLHEFRDGSIGKITLEKAE